MESAYNKGFGQDIDKFCVIGGRKRRSLELLLNVLNYVLYSKECVLKHYLKIDPNFIHLILV